MLRVKKLLYQVCCIGIIFFCFYGDIWWKCVMHKSCMQIIVHVFGHISTLCIASKIHRELEWIIFAANLTKQQMFQMWNKMCYISHRYHVWWLATLFAFVWTIVESNKCVARMKAHSECNCIRTSTKRERGGVKSSKYIDTALLEGLTTVINRRKMPRNNRWIRSHTQKHILNIRWLISTSDLFILLCKYSILAWESSGFSIIPFEVFQRNMRHHVSNQQVRYGIIARFCFGLVEKKNAEYAQWTSSMLAKMIKFCLVVN